VLHTVAHVVHQLGLTCKPLLTFCTPISVLFLPLQSLDFLESFWINVLNLLLRLLVLPVGGAVVACAPGALGAVWVAGAWGRWVWRAVGGWSAAVALFWSSAVVWVVMEIILCSLWEVWKEWRHVWWNSLLGGF